MDVVSPGLNGHVPAPDPDGAFHSDTLVQHLADLLEVTLGASTEDLQRPGSLLSSTERSDTARRCTRFASESMVAIYVQKNLADIQQVNGDGDPTGERSSPAKQHRF